MKGSVVTVFILLVRYFIETEKKEEAKSSSWHWHDLISESKELEETPLSISSRCSTNSVSLRLSLKERWLNFFL